MAAKFVTNGRRVAAAAVLTLAMGGVMAMAQDNSAAPAPQDQQGQGQWSQHGRGGPGGQEHRLEMMTKRLDLTPDQVSQIKAIQADGMSQAKAVHEDTTLSQGDRHAKMMSIRQASESKVRAVLNDQQKTKFDAMEAHRHERMQHGEGQAPTAPPA